MNKEFLDAVPDGRDDMMKWLDHTPFRLIGVFTAHIRMNDGYRVLPPAQRLRRMEQALKEYETKRTEILHKLGWDALQTTQPAAER